MHAVAVRLESIDHHVAPRPHTRIVWLAAADARGHLMRAHLLRQALAHRGVAVDLVTTSVAGQRFLAAMGSPSRVLSSHYAIAFDGAENLDRARTERCLLAYLADPRRGMRDVATLRSFACGADLLVNDFHPLPLVAPRHLGAPVVHVYGTHLWEAIAHHFSHRAPDFVDRISDALACALRDRAFAHLEHTLCQRPGETGLLPPIVGVPARSRAQVRSTLRLAPGQRLAAVYLNPHFVEVRLAVAIERALTSAGFAIHAVGEGFAARPQWRAFDPDFNDIAAAANVLVSSPGMGALSAWAHFGTPLLALTSDQPEQAANVGFLSAVRAAPYAVLRASDAQGDALDAALAQLVSTARGPRPDPARAAREVQMRWVEAICELVTSAQSRARH